MNVIERDYLLRPQSEGELTIAPFTLRGTVADPNARRDPFADFAFGSPMMQQMMQGSPFGSMFNQGKPFAARSDGITFDVLANPGAGTSDWFLPAKAVQIQAEWQPADPSFREGEAVTRQISLLALGARPEQLPDLTFSEPDGARIYLDDTQTDMVSTADGTVARRDFQISVVPTRGGQVTLPEITVEWLNTATDKTETAVLPALSIDVEGTIQAAPPVKPVSDTQVTAGPVAPQPVTSNFALWGAGLAILIVGAGCVAVYRRNTRRARNATIPADQSGTLRHCARTGDQAAFYCALLALRANPGKANIAELEHAIAEFERHAFAPVAVAKAPDLHGIVKKVFPRETRGSLIRVLSNRPKRLAPLYPSS